MAVITSIAVIGGISENRKARKENAEASRNEAKARDIRFKAEQSQARAEQRIREVQQRRERIKSVREARRTRAKVQAQAEATGVGVSTSAFGAVGGVRTQFASSLSSSRIIGGIQEGIVQTNLVAGQQAQSFLDLATENRINANRATSRAGLFNTAASISGKFA